MTSAIAEIITNSVSRVAIISSFTFYVCIAKRYVIVTVI